MKKIYQSKTFWVFFLLLVGSILNELGVVNLELSKDANWITIALSFIAIVLRLVTKEPINFNGGKQ